MCFNSRLGCSACFSSSCKVQKTGKAYSTLWRCKGQHRYRTHFAPFRRILSKQHTLSGSPMKALQGHQAYFHQPHQEYCYVATPCSHHSTALHPSTRRLGRLLPLPPGHPQLCAMHSRRKLLMQVSNSLFEHIRISSMTKQYAEPSIPSASTDRKTAHVLAAVAAPKTPSTSAVSLSPSLRRDTAVLEVENPAAPTGKTQVQPPASVGSIAASKYPLLQLSPFQAGPRV